MTIDRTHNGPVAESEINARNNFCDEGKSTCDCALPAPADLDKVNRCDATTWKIHDTCPQIVT